MDEGLKNLVTKAEQGDVDAMIMVGDCYNRGLHTEKDDQEAHRYYKMAADKGHVQANLMVAIDLLNGIGTKSRTPSLSLISSMAFSISSCVYTVIDLIFGYSLFQ